MLDANGQFPLPPKTSSAQEFSVIPIALRQWMQRVVGQRRVQVKLRMRGNNLHVLWEEQPCPAAELVLSQFHQVLAELPLEQALTPESPQIHRIMVYGRSLGETKPDWTRTIDIHWQSRQLEGKDLASGSLETEPLSTSDSHQEVLTAIAPSPQIPTDSTFPGASSNLERARQGNPEAIAYYLSETFSRFGIDIRVRLESAAAKQEGGSEVSGISASQDSGKTARAVNRLLILCESGYSPDPSLLAEPLSQRLRGLELTGFRDAVVFGQVSGESRPEWMLRVDLTSPDKILREWARWGDVQAIAYLLNRLLATQQLSFSVLLREGTLHVSCAAAHETIPDQEPAIAAISPLLRSFAPQGIQAAAVYGVSSVTADASDLAPAWVHWLQLAAASQPELVPVPLALAQQGNLSALTFLLTRLLNPDLDTKLATGGIRVQIRQKSDLLHIMTDAPYCPRQDAVAPAIARFLKPLQIDSIAGIRIYGRRFGQKQPLWNYGTDFVVRTRLIERNRIVPEATPEFAASDSHVEDLLAPAGALVVWTEQPATGWESALKRLYEQLLAGVQRSLVSTQLFIPADAPVLSSNIVPANAVAHRPFNRQRWGIALLWGTVGMLFVVQSDWLLGQWLRSTEQQAAEQKAAQHKTAIAPSQPAQALPLPSMDLQKSKPQGWSSANTPFTEAGKTAIVAPNTPKPESGKSSNALPASPLQAKADTIIGQVDYPSFNSRQLDGQIALYKKYLEINGAPDVLVVGSSRALRGIDPIALESALAEQGYVGIKVFNLGINGATVQVVDLMLHQILPQDRLPKLIVFADGSRAFNSGRVDVTYNGVIASEGYRALMAGNPPIPGAIAAQPPANSPNAKPSQSTQASASSGAADSSPSLASQYRQVNESLNQALGSLSVIYGQRDRLKTKLQGAIAALLPQHVSPSEGVIASSDSLLNSSSPVASASTDSAIASDGQGIVDINGFLPLSVRFNPVTYYQKYSRVSGDYDSDYEAFNLEGSQMEALAAMARYAQLRQVPLVFVNLPLTQEYLDPARKRHEEEFQQQMLARSPQLGIVYRDLSATLTTQPSYFSDPSHLNRYGAYEVSRRLAQDGMIPWKAGK